MRRVSNPILTGNLRWNVIRVLAGLSGAAHDQLVERLVGPFDLHRQGRRHHGVSAAWMRASNRGRALHVDVAGLRARKVGAVAFSEGGTIDNRRAGLVKLPRT